MLRRKKQTSNPAKALKLEYPNTISTTMLARFSTLLLLSSILTLQGCSSNRPAPVEPASNQQATQPSEPEPSLQSQAYVNAPIQAESITSNSAAFEAQQLLNDARLAPGHQRPALILLAVEYLWLAENPRDAIKWLEQIDISYLSTTELPRFWLLQARSMAFTNRNSEALAQLERINFEQLDNAYKADFLQITAQAQLALGNKREALEALADRETFISRDLAASNQQALLEIIDSTTDAELAAIQAATSNQTLLQWIELISLSDSSRSDGFDSALTPNNITPFEQTADLESNWGPTAPRRIALLLPLSSQFRSAAQAFEQGFRQANRRNNASVSIVTYDISGSENQIQSVINQAAADGAEFIVGPLGKVAAQAAIDSTSYGSEFNTVPLLVLGGDIRVASPELTVFTLSPEQEAQAIARHAYQTGQQNAAVIYPDTPYGNRMNQAFASAWQSFGGKLVKSAMYPTGHYDYSDVIKNLLDITSSTARLQQLSATLSFQPEFVPARRQDIDFLFLAANSAEARLLKPQLSFHQAHDLPVYSPSAVYAGKPDAINDADLNKIIFPTMPWSFNTELAASNGVRSQLHAFGFDCYQLIPIITQLRNSNQFSYQGLTGRLTINEQGEVMRQPEWATFRDGLAGALDADPDTTTSEETPGVRTTIDNQQPANMQGSNRYDSRTWDTGQNRRKSSP